MNTGTIGRSRMKSNFFFLVMSFKIEFFACGLTSVNRDLVLLGIEDFSISVIMITRLFFLPHSEFWLNLEWYGGSFINYIRVKR